MAYQKERLAKFVKVKIKKLDKGQIVLGRGLHHGAFALKSNLGRDFPLVNHLELQGIDSVLAF